MISRPLIILLFALMSNLLTAQDDPIYLRARSCARCWLSPSRMLPAHIVCQAGTNAELRRGATSLALVDPAANSKYLFEATPHLPEQLYNLERIAPDRRYSLGGIFLTHAHIGHYTGLMFFWFRVYER